MANGGALALSLVLISWAIFMRMIAGTWLQPAAFFALWWCFAGILPLILAPNEPVGANAMLWLIAASIAVWVGNIAGNYGSRTRLNPNPSPATDRELFVFGWIIVVSIALGMASNIAFIIGSGVGFGDLFDIQKIIVVSNRLYVQRFSDIPPPPPRLSQALLPFVYLAPAAAGILFVLRKEARWKLIALAAFLPALGVTILQTTKGAVLYAVIFWLSGYFAARLRNGRLKVFTKAHLLTATIVLASMTTLFFATSFARLASTDAALLNVVIAKLVSAAFGHMTVFSQWLGEYWNGPFAPSLGRITFAGPLEMIGHSQRVPGIFEQVIALVMGETSNIYTAFRPLIEDFTIPGALAVLALLGAVGGVGFRQVAAGNWSGVPLLLIAYTTTMWSPVTWIWIYNSLTATLFVLLVIVIALRIWRGKPSRDRLNETVIAG